MNTVYVAVVEYIGDEAGAGQAFVSRTREGLINAIAEYVVELSEDQENREKIKVYSTLDAVEQWFNDQELGEHLSIFGPVAIED